MQTLGGEAGTLGVHAVSTCAASVLAYPCRASGPFVAHLLLRLDNVAQRTSSGHHLRSMLPAVFQHTEQISAQLPNQILRVAALPVQEAL